MRARRYVVSAVFAAFSVAGLASVASAQTSPYPPAAITVSITGSTAIPGGTVLATVSGCRPGDVVSASLVSSSGATVSTGVQGIADSSGKATITFVTPNTAGSYTVSGSCSGSTVVGSSLVRVAQVAGSGALPGAGGRFADILVPATVLLLGGSTLVIASHRRRRGLVTAAG